MKSDQEPSPVAPPRRPWWRLYLGLLLASHLVWALGSNRRDLPTDWQQSEVSTQADETHNLRQTLAWKWSGSKDPDSPTLVLLHGSPGRGANFDRLVQALPEHLRVLTLDLPGYGASGPLGPDLSARGAALQLSHLLKSLQVEKAHLLGWSLGGAVALELADHNPEQVQSIFMLASLGVIEFELLGSQTLNHGLHLLLLNACRAARWGLPHFGAWDGLAPLMAFGRSFAETDQRRLREILNTLDLPVRILHGSEDPLIPVAAAREHARIVPQAELEVLAGQSHFLPFSWTEELARDLSAWVTRVETGQAKLRQDASAERLARARLPLDPRNIPPLAGPALILFGLLLALATLGSEDLACIAAGFLVADGRMDWMTASLFCFLGIFSGDLLLFGAGRLLGRSALLIAPFKWMISEDSVARASRWLHERGARVIFTSRFLPGLRLPIYFTAGVLRTSVKEFALWFAVAGLIWTPILVGGSALVAKHYEVRLDQVDGLDVIRFAAIALGTVFLLHNVLRLFTWRGRRILLGRWRRLTRHEFWPPWLYYSPVILDVLLLTLRHRGLTMTAANPAMPMGGLIGESKAQILEGLGEGPEIPAWILLDPNGEQQAKANEWIAARNLDLPLVLKPDAGQRGAGVTVLHTAQQLQEALDSMPVPSLLMEYVPGEEFGVFWVQPPDTPRGKIVGLTIKRLPTVAGDGQRTLEQLILADPRAVALHRVYARELSGRMNEVPRAGSEIPLVEVGTHSRGAIFLDGKHLITPELEAAVARIADRYQGFHLGRFDFKVPSSDHLQRGEDLRVIELNGVTSEQTEMWDPKHSLWTTWRMQHTQWSRAFRVGALCAQKGAKVSTLRAVLTEVWRFRQSQRN